MWRSMWFLSALLAVAGCGRTQLDPCDDTLDAPRPCSGFCGAGTQTCVGGRWSACDVPVVTRACSNDCGDGTQTCVGKTWQDCDVAPVTRACSSACGDGTETCSTGSWAACTAPQPRPPKLTTTVRDFHAHQPSDFERTDVFGDHLELGIVAPELGPDDKPVYAGDPILGTVTTSGVKAFNQWYNDVPGVNLRTMIDLPLTALPARPDFFAYEDLSFFPIDNQLFGNEGNYHNFHFTLEAHTHFRYVGGETFYFSGDDDTWVFINRSLVINLGGLHSARQATVDLDAAASALQLTKGERYQLDIFFAERHTSASEFTIRTSIADASSCD